MDLKVIEAQEWKNKLGYGPNPHCHRCGGSGWVHPHLPAGKLNYTEVIPCYSPGCLKDSIAHKIL